LEDAEGQEASIMTAFDKAWDTVKSNSVQECVDLWHEKEWANEDNDEEKTNYYGGLFHEKWQKLSDSEKQEVRDILGSMG
tara:strand:- start:197 stop:436 length:240 start_codon:yes stop_codon:yes gene_type:complete